MQRKLIGIDARMYGAGFTGIGRYNFELIRHLAELDQVNEYIIFLRKEAYLDFEVPNDRFKKVLADYSHYTFGEQIGFLKLLNSLKLDLMHFTHFNLPIFYSRPYVVTVHDLTPSFFPGKKMNRPWHKWAYQLVLRSLSKKARRLIAVSHHTKKDIIKMLSVPTDKINVIHNGVSSDFLEAPKTPKADLMKKLGLQKPFFLYTGVWRDHKNLVGMIKAFSQFNQKIGDQYELVITGRHNPTYHEIPDTISDLNLKKSVHLVGMVSELDLRGLYQSAFAYVFPSFYEGFGLPPLEAMQCNTPVLASSCASIPEICGEGNALYFDAYSVEDMADKMTLMAKDASLRQRLVDQGADWVKRFDWKRSVGHVLDLYNEVISD